MENELKILLYRIGLTENEADDILNIAPEFENLSAQDFLCNCKILNRPWQSCSCKPFNLCIFWNRA